MKARLPAPFHTIKTALSSCDVYLGAGLLGAIQQIAAVAGASGIALVTDRTTRRLFGARAARALASPPRPFVHVTIPPGEKSKNLALAAAILETLAARRLDRDCAVVAIGGGVVSDVAGFVASIYLRGVAWVAAPTTLLAMADAAIGGKTGVDLRAGKNLAGSIWPPRAVAADLGTLVTLPRRERACGLAEIIKIALACDADLFTSLERRGARLLTCPPRALRPLLERAILLKARLVERDERDRGARLALNLGHTTAHALEAALDYQRLRHGEAVAIGLRAACALAEKITNLDPGVARRVDRLLQNAGLPARIPAAADRSLILRKIQIDKKNRAGDARFVLPVAVGKVTIAGAPRADLRRIINNL